MSETKERCTHLHRLQTSLIQEISALQSSIRAEDQEGVGNPSEMRTIIKSLQVSLNHVNLELEKCPSED